MRKILLIALAVGTGTVINAQNRRIEKAPSLQDYAADKMRLIESTNLTKKPNGTVQNSPHHISGISKIATPITNKVPCGNSANVLGSIVSESNNVNANQDLGLTVFTHRANSEYVGTVGTVNIGDFNASYSTDCSTWDSTLITSDPGSTNMAIFMRYPTGAIYNPPGNTNPNQAIVVGSGPWHLGPANSWAGTYFTSGRLDGTNLNLDTVQIGGASGNNYHMGRIGGCTTDQGDYFVLGSDFSWNNTAGAILNGFDVFKGSWDAGNNKFNWSTIYIPNLYDDNDFGNIAFSQDGSVGYVVTMGRDSNTANNHLSAMPLILKSTDGGLTWNLDPVYDFSNAYNMSNLLDSTNDGLYKRPYFLTRNGFDLTVDANYNLHIVCEVVSSYSNHPDSLDYFWGASHIMDVFGSGTTWTAHLVSDLLAAPVPAATSPWINAGAGQGWDARIQCGRTKDGVKVFYGWMDTDPQFDPTNLYPDIHLAGMDVNTLLATTDNNITVGTAYEAINLWLYVSTTVFANSGTYNVPMVTTDSRDPALPGAGVVQHFAVCGAQLTDADFVNPIPTGIENVNVTNANIHQNYPNPAKDYTTISFNLNKGSSVKLAVTDVLGKVIFSSNQNQMSSGNHEITVNTKGLSAGVYSYTLTINGEKSSHKMIVE